MTSSSAPSEPVTVPIRVLLPGDQDVVGHLWSKRQVRDGWLYEVGLPAYLNGLGDTVEPAESAPLGRRALGSCSPAWSAERSSDA
ncbi:hypothetical protein OHU17_35465 (plasmid) [Streptomyces goshikiensis]|uniref:Uncharacterized protein n=1 Tax=Streptomyces goshikiensis TaxID=1942 RepID=A0ABZ1RWK8_9ACTN|nr:hypothetical protein [Streptomyces goshikiensis]